MNAIPHALNFSVNDLKIRNSEMSEYSEKLGKIQIKKPNPYT